MYWHTTSHIMAQAVKRLYPAAKVTIGPSIENGFYYDFDVEKPFTEEDLLKIEEENEKNHKEHNEHLFHIDLSHHYHSFSTI